jgi:hypothetical protein
MREFQEGMKACRENMEAKIKVGKEQMRAYGQQLTRVDSHGYSELQLREL